MEMKRTILFFPLFLRQCWHMRNLRWRMPTLGTDQLSAGAAIRSDRESPEYNLENAGKGYLPQFTLSGKATYQSDVTKLPVDIPGIDMKSMPKDQYQVMLEVSQNIWDGGDIRSKKQLTRATSEIDRGKQEVDMYALNDRVNQLYFGILLLDEQLRQNQLCRKTWDALISRCPTIWQTALPIRVIWMP